MWNEELRVLLPPLDATFNATAAHWTTVSFTVLTVITFFIGIQFWRNTKNPIVLLMLLGGLTTVLVEPYLDVLGGAWHPIHGQNVAFELMGRPIPWWVVPCYMFLFGGLGTLNYMAFTKGATMRQVWLWFFVPMSIDIVMEEIDRVQQVPALVVGYQRNGRFPRRGNGDFDGTLFERMETSVDTAHHAGSGWTRLRGGGASNDHRSANPERTDDCEPVGRRCHFWAYRIVCVLGRVAVGYGFALAQRQHQFQRLGCVAAQTGIRLMRCERRRTAAAVAFFKTFGG